MTPEKFSQYCAERGLSLNAQQLDQFSRYYQHLIEENQKYNLTAITDEESVYRKHFLDSLLASFKVQPEGKVADIGSGAGFPGLVLKIAYPSIDITLLDSNGKRCRFLEETAALLGLDKVSVKDDRAEDFSNQNRESYDMVTARAVAPLPILLEISGALVKEGGWFVAMRGLKGLEEKEEAAHAAKEMGFECTDVQEENLPDIGQRIIIYYRKVKVTPKKYPRPYPQIKKKCL